MHQLTLYDYYRSSSSFRVRIALNLKHLAYQAIAIDLLKEAHFDPDYLTVNPQRLVPALHVDDTTMTQSLAIIEWLEDNYPQPPLLPADPLQRVQVKSLAYTIAMDIQPLNNLRVLKYLKRTCEWSQEQVNNWYQHWIATGFSAIESQLQAFQCGGKFCFGDAVTLADVCLIPQVYNAERFHCDLTEYPLLCSVTAHCRSLEAFAKAAPEAVGN